MEARRVARGQAMAVLDRLRIDFNPFFYVKGTALQKEADKITARMGKLGSEILRSDIWKGLDAAFGKCDCMVDGKYKKARVFCFETDSIELACITETGDRGSTWLIGSKGHGEEAPSVWRRYSDFSSDRVLMGQAVEALEDIFAKASIARPQDFPELSSCPGAHERAGQLRAEAEKKTIETQVEEPKPAARAPRRKGI